MSMYVDGNRKIAPYGSWKSPVTPEYVSGKDRVLAPNIQCDGEDIYFIEQRPDEGGRAVLMCLQPGGLAKEVLPNEFNVRTRYLEYGGLCFLVADRVCYFVHFDDQEIYVAEPGNLPRRLTKENGNRFADFILDKERYRLLALREIPGQPESKNSICAIDLNTGRVEDLVCGSDFYDCVRLNGDQLSWISWNHPNMPWNGTELWVANVNQLNSPQMIAGGKTQAVSQARWSESGDIYFIAEVNKYMNLYRFMKGRVENVFPLDGEFCSPAWVPGIQQYAISGNGCVCATYLHRGRWQIVRIDADGTTQAIASSIASIYAVHTYKDYFVALIAHSFKPPTLVSVDLNGGLHELYSTKSRELSSEFISVAEELQYPTEDGGLGYAWYYSPKSADHIGPMGEKPPLIVCAHGGPTAMSPPNFRKEYQFWTTRGYAVVDVNYGGSSGYGKIYRERLNGNWGLVDVGDCVSAVKMLVAKGLVDANRIAIRGGSAGGYTTLAALAFTKNIFSAGASYFGVSDLASLAKETHKFESRYLDQLVGPYPEAIDVYRARAPLVHVDQFSCPIIFFQGDDDKVVPPAQSEIMHNELKRRGIVTEYHLYRKEGHGFRRAETNQHALKTEHTFYARIFNFETQLEDRVSPQE